MNFYETITAAIRDITAHGYDSQKRIDGWLAKLRAAACAQMMPERQMQAQLRKAMEAIYRRLVLQGQVWKYQEDSVSKFTLANVKPKLRAELDRRIAASADLIRLNREAAIQKTLQRFSGWSTSIPKGGTLAPGKGAAAMDIRKGMAQLGFVERRVMIDQGHKLVSAINDIVATDGGAIAAIWRSNWRQKNYDYREDHKERDEHVYLIRDSWAHKAGLVKPGKVGYTDQITQPGEEVYCRCNYQYLYTLGKLPPEMLTGKGKAKLAQAQEKVKEATK
jgi:hypothetical protein